MVRAALVTEAGTPMTVREVTLDGPGPGQVRVRLAATGVCHSDLSLARGRLRQQLPAVLGHEAARVVAEVAPAWARSSRATGSCCAGHRRAGSAGTAWPGSPTCASAQPTAPASPTAPRAAGRSTPGCRPALSQKKRWSGENAVVPKPADVPLEQAALLGCAVMTGVGAVLNTVRVRRGQSVVVIGLGGVGLSVVQGARIAGASPIIAVDRSASRRDGALTIVGIGGGKEDQVSFGPVELFHFARTIRGCVYGSTDPDRDFPLLFEYLRSGAVDVESMISRRISLDDVESAFSEMEAGVGARSLVAF